MEPNIQPNFMTKNPYVNKVLVKKLQSYIPESRAYGVVELVKEDEIFFHGGSNRLKDYCHIDILDLHSLEWVPVNERSVVDPFFIFDKTLSGHSSILVKNQKDSKIIIYGGFDGISYSNGIYEIETVNYQLKQIDIRRNNSGEYPLPRCYHSCNYEEQTNSFYVFGGWNGSILLANNQNFFALWKFDLISKIIVKIY